MSNSAGDFYSPEITGAHQSLFISTNLPYFNLLTNAIPLYISKYPCAERSRKNSFILSDEKIL